MMTSQTTAVVSRVSPCGIDIIEVEFEDEDSFVLPVCSTWYPIKQDYLGCDQAREFLQSKGYRLISSWWLSAEYKNSVLITRHE